MYLFISPAVQKQEQFVEAANGKPHNDHSDGKLNMILTCRHRLI